ncbi:hypothetical protein DN051_37915 [Streptomyces cadmiisoli]|uniref:Uncharacterized protein n=1 Tax=Streptomyces cadmiisoli TaxID=2184053 RepID=A0A2Z4JBH9_9ACTN|nr:hypothetical protein DN051_37915 [Streptomyces cadmiisoli]
MAGTMDNRTPQPTWQFALPWAELDVFTRGPVPATLQPTATVLAHLEDRFRPALLRTRLGPEGAYAAVWPADRPLPQHPGNTERALEDLRDVVLAQIHALTCHVCTVRFQGLYPDPGIPFFGRHLASHRLINGCPGCGSDFATSRIQALVLLPPT